MNYWLIGIAVIVTIVGLLIYKFVFNPTIVYTPLNSDFDKCPDRWSWDSQSKKCVPGYTTSCLPFNPDLVNTASAKCTLARSCNTTWSGFCA